AVRRRAPLVASADARAAQFQTLLGERALGGLSGPLQGPARSAAARVAELLAPCAPGSEAPDLSAAVQALAPQPARQPAAQVDARTDPALDGTDLLARLYCRALAPALMPGTEGPSERAKDVLSPASVSAAALRRALLAALARLRRGVQAELLRARRPCEEAAEGLQGLRPQMRCGACAGELPCRACAPPARAACRCCLAERPRPCTAACAAPPACAKTGRPGELEAASAKRLLRVRWPLGGASCPLCGSAARAAAECEQCGEGQKLEAAWLPAPQGARRRAAARVKMRPGAAAWWGAPRPGLLRLARHRGWLCRGGAAPALLVPALGRLGAAELARELPLLMLRKLRGPGAGARADAPREERGVRRREPPLHDATCVGAGLRPSQVRREGRLRRRSARTKRGRADHYDASDKTQGQKEAAPASLRFPPSALQDEEGERASAEAVQAAAAAMIEEREAGAAAPQHCRLLVEHCGLPGRSRRLEEAALLNRRLRRELDVRMVEFRVGELAGLSGAGRARDQRLRGDEPPLTYSLPLGELQMHCPRALALPPPPGHPARQGPQTRAMPACCTERPASLRAAEGRGPVAAPCAWSPTVSDGRLGAGGHGARAQGALFSVAYLDHFDGSTYEDAGSTTEQFAQEQGRCFALATPLQVRGQDKRAQRVAPLAELRRRAPLRQQAADRRYDHLGSSGRARGFVLKGAALAALQDGEHVRAPFDAWVEDWSESRRGVDVVVLVAQHAWQSGVKVAWQLQKSVLTSVSNGLWAAGAALLRDRLDKR
ncbi:unnamed protein product, partial [Prorocentrum cordatum]